MKFASTGEAADLLCAQLAAQHHSHPRLVIAVGADGLPLAHLIADRLGAALEAPRVEHLTLPWSPRQPYGALTADNHHYLDPVIVADHSLGMREIAQQCRERLPVLRGPGWRKPRPIGAVEAIVVARALSTGYRALALAAAARAGGATSVIVASPCAARDASQRIVAPIRQIVLSISDEAWFDPDACFPPLAPAI